MKSIVVTYPGYQDLPRGIKRLLVESETSFFSEAAPDRSINQPGHKTLWQQPTNRITGGNGSLWNGLSRSQEPNRRKHQEQG